MGFQGLQIVTGGAAGGGMQPHLGSQRWGSNSRTRMAASPPPMPQLIGMQGFTGGQGFMGGQGRGGLQLSGGQGRGGRQGQLPLDIINHPFSGNCRNTCYARGRGRVKMGSKRLESAKNGAFIIVGLMICSLAYRLYLVPNEVAPGGFTGVGQLLNALIGVKVGTVALIMNVPLFAVSMHHMGIRFGVKSFLASTALSLLIDFLPVDALTSDPLLSAIFGGVMGGAGFGLILRGSATTGGSDMLGALIHSKIPAVKVGVIVFAVDGIVVFASAFVFSPVLAMYALIAASIMNYTMDFVLEGFNRASAFLIVSKESEAIGQRILKEMERGVTGLSGRGLYSGEGREVLLCVISRFETMQLRRIVGSLDPSAFMIAINAREVLGEGFKDIHPGKIG